MSLNNVGFLLLYLQQKNSSALKTEGRGLGWWEDGGGCGRVRGYSTTEPHISGLVSLKVTELQAQPGCLKKSLKVSENKDFLMHSYGGAESCQRQVNAPACSTTVTPSGYYRRGLEFILFILKKKKIPFFSPKTRYNKNHFFSSVLLAPPIRGKSKS